MTTALVVGAGAVGTHAARHFLDDPNVTRVLLVDPEHARVADLVDELGDGVEASEWSPDHPMPVGVDMVACALPGVEDAAVVDRAIEAGIPVASAADSRRGVTRVLAADLAARGASVPVVVGAGLMPGLSEVLARFGADALDEVDEVHVARLGAAGPACVRSLRSSAWGRAEELADGRWQWARAGGGRRLVYFPPPAGPHDCRRVDSPTPRLLAALLPSIQHVTVRGALRRRDRVTGGHAPVAGDGGLGALHVEVHGRRGSSRQLLTYGVVDRVASLSGTVLAVATLLAAGVLGESGPPPAGVQPFAGLGDAAYLLSELAARGVRAARFSATAA